jgi:predicted nucleotidyltransferase
MAFETLLDRLLPEGPLRAAIDVLLAKKRISKEVADGPRIPEISDFIERQLQRMETTAPMLTPGHGDQSRLDEFFRRAIAD